MEFYHNVLIEYSLTGIVKPKFDAEFQKYKIWQKKLRKTQDRTSLSNLHVKYSLMYTIPQRVKMILLEHKSSQLVYDQMMV